MSIAEVLRYIQETQIGALTTTEVAAQARGADGFAHDVGVGLPVRIVRPEHARRECRRQLVDRKEHAGQQQHWRQHQREEVRHGVDVF